LMSMGYHYAETIQQSLTLQLIDKHYLPVVMGRQIAVGAFTGLFAFAALYLLVDLLDLGYRWIYLLGGSLTIAIACVMIMNFPHFKGEAEQHKKIVVRRRYWLY